MDLLATYPVVIELPVVWGEMDAYRHVNNVVYFRYLESARLEYFRRLDWFEYEKLTGVGPILAATDARFRKPLTYPDTIRVGARIVSIGDDRFTLEHSIASQKQDSIVTEGHGVIVMFNYQEGKKAVIPEELLRRIEKLEGHMPPKSPPRP
jgi:acyl-CoA thioester hydrolase